MGWRHQRLPGWLALYPVYDSFYNRAMPGLRFKVVDYNELARIHEVLDMKKPMVTVTAIAAVSATGGRSLCDDKQFVLKHAIGTECRNQDKG
jgi:hypothetical protein